MKFPNLMKLMLALSLTSSIALASTEPVAPSVDDSEEIYMCKLDTLNDVLDGYTIASTSDRTTLAYDKKTVKATKSGATLWVAFVNSRSNEDAYKEDEGYVMGLIELDFTSKRFKTIDATGYNCNGIQSTRYNKGTWDVIYPKSLMDSLMISVKKDLVSKPKKK